MEGMLSCGFFKPGGGGALQYQMDTGVRLTLPKAGAFGEGWGPGRLGHLVRTQSQKNEGSLGEKPNFGLKLGSIG